MRLRANAEQEEIDGVRPENVFEMGLSVSCMDESVDSTSKVLVSVMMFVIEVEKETNTAPHVPQSKSRCDNGNARKQI